jgi:hypothetical protein
LTCSLFKISRRFGERCRLHLQGQISKIRNQSEIKWQAELVFDPKNGAETFLGKVGRLSTA